MPVVASWDFAARRIYMGAAVWHPHEIYTEYRAYRRTTEAARQYAALLRMEGNVDKGGGKATPRYMVLLDGTKIVPVDGATAPITEITGELFSDDQTDFIDISGLTVAPRINYEPPAAEIITVQTGSGVLPGDVTDIANAVAALANWSAVDVATLSAPAVQEVGDAVLDNLTEGSLTLRQSIRLLLATLVGRVSGAPNGPIIFRGISDTKDRITATVDASGNRTNVVWDADE